MSRFRYLFTVDWQPVELDGGADCTNRWLAGASSGRHDHVSPPPRPSHDAVDHLSCFSSAVVMYCAGSYPIWRLNPSDAASRPAYRSAGLAPSSSGGFFLPLPL